MKKHKLVHADLKPDNILIRNNHKTCKLSDFGSAFPLEENSITELLISRYYRPPEIILGLPYDNSVDMWSFGCTVFELYTGKFLFTGDNNNQMLKQIQALKGRIPNKMLKKGEFVNQHFDENYQFLS